tara:strand:- start:11657 stop:11965 length:309 start_codon:yes stop_codon:yes gene_type:complete
MALVRDAKVGDLYQVMNREATIPVYRPTSIDESRYTYRVGWQDYPIGFGLVVKVEELYKGAYLIYVGPRQRDGLKYHAFKTFKGPETFLFRGKAFKHLKEIN